jgi:hypothetical protein
MGALERDAKRRVRVEEGWMWGIYRECLCQPIKRGVTMLHEGPRYADNTRGSCPFVGTPFTGPLINILVVVKSV